MNAEILCSSRELFGADRSALRLAAALQEIGWEPRLVLPANRPELGLAQEAASRGLPTREAAIAIASSQGVESLSSLMPKRTGQAPSVTIFNTTAVLGTGTSINRKVVVVREWLDPSSPRHRLLAARHRIGADAVVGVSSDVVEQWRRCIRGPSRQHVVHNWLEDSTLDSLGSEDDEAPAGGILFLGRFNSWKGHDALADAYEAAFASTERRPPLTFVGAQSEGEFATRASELRRRGATLGWSVLPFTTDPSSHLRQAALVVVPSLRPEPFGTVVLEAIAHGCYVIAYDGGGPSDMATDFPDVLQVIPRDTRALATALGSWWREGGAAPDRAAVARAQATLSDRYSAQTGASSWQAVMDGLDL